MHQDTAAPVFASLGNPARLGVLRLLVRAGAGGLNIGEIRDALDIPASTLAHHLAHLAKAGTIRQERQGREVRNIADFDTITGALAYLMADCCAGVPLIDRVGECCD